jgi:hypothetical protein
MKSLAEWQKKLKEAADARFPNNTEGTFDRVTSLQNQLNDIKAAIAVEKGELQSNDHAHQDPNHRIAALIADALIFAEERDANTEHHLELVLSWFKNTAPKSE